MPPLAVACPGVVFVVVPPLPPLPLLRTAAGWGVFPDACSRGDVAEVVYCVVLALPVSLGWSYYVTI